jgi:hypothetical protein
LASTVLGWSLSEREIQLEREVSTADALDELLRRALGLELPAPSSPHERD